MNNKSTLFKLTGKVQHYQWGGSAFLPELLNMPNTEGNPFAEYWLGAHDNFPATIEGAEPKHLNEYVQENTSVLGPVIEQQFGRLPYLLKVLDVRDMLSIQVHPSKKSAVVEFDKENNAGISLQDPKRNYKDNNHKPELMVALSDFWLLHGFKTEELIRSTAGSVAGFEFMLELFDQGGYEKLYNTLMEMDQSRVNSILAPVLNRIVPAYQNDKLQKNDPNFWAARAAITFDTDGNIDRGIFSVYLLNLVNLKFGEAIFQDAGVLHAYLEGQNMEIMANSDNVLRGGLTPKHIDVKELMKHVNFAATVPRIIRGTSVSSVEEVYLSPAADFQLSKLCLGPGQVSELTPATTEIFFLLSGSVVLTDSNKKNIELHKGEAAVAFPGSNLNIQGNKDAVIFRASVPALP